MKFVDQNTFIVSLLLGILVIYKVLSIDGFTDILWIILMGSLTIKGLRSSFSKELHERDIRQAYQKKVLIQNIFGKFAIYCARYSAAYHYFSWNYCIRQSGCSYVQSADSCFSGIFRGICSMDQSVYCKA